VFASGFSESEAVITEPEGSTSQSLVNGLGAKDEPEPEGDAEFGFSVPDEDDSDAEDDLTLDEVSQSGAWSINCFKPLYIT
jgi:hypothetical protein